MVPRTVATCPRIAPVFPPRPESLPSSLPRPPASRMLGSLKAHGYQPRVRRPWVTFAVLATGLLAAGITTSGPAFAAEAKTIDFSRDVLPILSDRCFHCHGPDETHREAGLRLDVRESAVEDLGGYATVVPGDPDASELIVRVTDEDPDLRMPPASAHRRPLEDAEIETLRRWIAEGAEWGRHWSFEPPTRPELPERDAESSQHPIDRFVRAKLRHTGLDPSPPADPRTLLRRISFDLTGLPPTPEQADAFAAEPSDEAYADTVDRLLDSPHFGERMAMWWLDAARYSDTDGYQQDANRSNWPWRDWVVEAFNRNLPFDRFTIEQFAGDLLPDATPEQILATCFHRNHMTNGEGGRDPEESRIDYVIDRVNTTGTVWMGLTLGCAQCHTHKFDPISHHDYYRMFAFFDSIAEDGKAGRGAKPYLQTESPFAERAVREAERVVESRREITRRAESAAEAEFAAWLADQVRDVGEGFQPWHPLQASSLESVEGTILRQDADGIVQASGPNPRQDDYRLIASVPESLPDESTRDESSHNAEASTANEHGSYASGSRVSTPDLGSRITGFRLEVFPHDSHTDGKLSRGESGEFVLTNVKLQVRRKGRSQLRDVEIERAIADVEKSAKGRNYGKVADTLDDDPRNGWTTETHDATVPHVAQFTLADPVVLSDHDELVLVLYHRSTVGDANLGRFRLSVTDQPGGAVRSLDPMPIEQLAAAGVENPDEIPEKLRDRLREQFLVDHAATVEAREHLNRAERQLASVKRAAGKQDVMVLSRRDEPRQTFVLERGVWDQKGDEVEPGVPSAILDRPGGEVTSRLDLARWLVDDRNPLTARVIANHLWQIAFGAGIVRTPDDFGLQGERPTHPDLLDWLAVELVESGWDLKHVLRLIVTSETYRQESAVTAEHLERDPENRLLARGARFRLPSWMLRDAALAASGLLNPAIGGPPVMPYQPEGVWNDMFMGRFRYEPSQGPAQHRRTLYAFWRRSAAPTFLFDSAQRRVCEVTPRLTNTPLQALTLMNDLNFLEPARELARDACESTSGDASPSESITKLFRSILSRPPSEAELVIATRELERAMTRYEREPELAETLLDFGQPELRVTGDAPRVAAHLLVASMIINLDEAITHE